MSWLWGMPQVGDWIITTRPIKVTLADHLLRAGAGVKVGTRGVVVRRLGLSRLEVRLDGGLFGGVTVTPRPGQLRVTRRGAGVEAFAARTGRLNAARLGVAAALLLPPTYFCVSWFVHGGSEAGLLQAGLDGVIYGIADLVGYALGHPVQALVYVVLLSLTGRFAFR